MEMLKKYQYTNFNFAYEFLPIISVNDCLSVFYSKI